MPSSASLVTSNHESIGRPQWAPGSPCPPMSPGGGRWGGAGARLRLAEDDEKTCFVFLRLQSWSLSSALTSSSRAMKRSSAMAVPITGRIMIRIKTDTYHHWAPRVAFWAAMVSGSVWVLAPMRKRAKRYSLHEKTSTSRNVAAGRDGRQRQGDRPEDPKGRRPIQGGAC